MDGADVEAVAQFPEPIAIHVDDRDVKGLAREVLGEGAADLAGAEDEDVHAQVLGVLTSRA